MKLTTEIPIPFTGVLSYRDKFLLLGSCFTEHIGEHFVEAHFNATINPFGILYNPASILNALNRLLSPIPYTEKDLFESHGMFHSWHHHGQFSSPSKEASLKKINDSLSQGAKQFKEATCLMITFGSATVWEYKNEVVSNCHKQPEKIFKHHRLDLMSIITDYTIFLNKLFQVNPDIKVIFTISPVRYFGKTILETYANKAVLFLAVENLVGQYKNVSYFPSFELVMDVLRDYRFYAEDLVHLSPLAFNYVWEKFFSSQFSHRSQHLYQELTDLNKSMNHRPLHPDSKDYIVFKNKLGKQVDHIKNKYPNLKF